MNGRRDQDELVFLPLGGVGEIGMNLGLYGLGPRRDRTWLAVDFGIAFEAQDAPGVDVMFPDIAYIEEDELVEVTPKSIRLRKRVLNPSFRKKRVKEE